MNIVNLGTIVDTLKINATFNNLAFEILPQNQDLELEKEIKNFNDKIDSLTKEKEKAQSIKNHDAQKRFINIELHKTQYRLMASASASYSIILQNGDISIFLRKFSKNVKNPVIKVEFRAEYLARCGYLIAVKKVLSMIENEFIINPVYKVKEIHLAADIQGYEFTPLDFYRIKTLSRTRTVFNEDEKNSYFSNQRFTGMTFGKGDLMLRIYNKTAEIFKNKIKGFIEVLKWQHHQDFNKDLNVWRIEGQIRRDKLKELCINESFTNEYGEEIKVNINLDSLESVLSAIPSIWKLFVNRYIHKNIKDSDIHEQIQGYKILKDGSIKILLPSAFKQRFKNADISKVWETISLFNGHQGYELDKFEDIKKPEVEYVDNAYKALISTYTKLMRGNFNTSKLVELIQETNKKYFNKKGYSILDGARINALDYLSSAKLYYKRNGFVFDGFNDFETDIKNNLSSIIYPCEEMDKKLKAVRKDIYLENRILSKENEEMEKEINKLGF